VLITNAQPITNGAQGLKGLPRFSTTFAVWAVAGLMILFMVILMRSSYGRALKAVRATKNSPADAMGINVFRVKVTSFTVSSFWAGVGGALLGHMITTIDPKMFTFMLTFIFCHRRARRDRLDLRLRDFGGGSDDSDGGAALPRRTDESRHLQD
jgi:branched-chain amino acid transport system permease protein